VREDGTAAPERLLQHLFAAPAAERPLWSAGEVARDVLMRYRAGDLPGAEDLAARYTFPLKYVEEVLLPSVNAARATAATSSGRSRAGSAVCSNRTTRRAAVARSRPPPPAWPRIGLAPHQRQRARCATRERSVSAASAPACSAASGDTAGRRPLAPGQNVQFRGRQFDCEDRRIFRRRAG
jgi:hypothetical protein